MKYHRILCFCLAAVLCLPALFGCQGGDPEIPGTAEAPDTAGSGTTDQVTNDQGTSEEESTTIESPVEVVLMENGRLRCVAVVPLKYSDTDSLAYTRLYNKIFELTGQRLELTYDCFEREAGQVEILIGNTSRAESVEYASEMYYNDYGTCIRNGHIVCTSPNATMTAKATELLIQRLVYDEEAKRIVLMSDFEVRINSYHYNLTINKIPLENYTIVHDGTEEATYAANSLQSFLSIKYSNTLPVYDHNTAPAGEYEILIGKTNRPESQTFYEKFSPELMVSHSAIVGKKLLFAGGGAYSLYKGIHTFANCFRRYMKDSAADFNSDYCGTVHYLNDYGEKIADNADLRVYEFNLLAEVFAVTDIETINRAEVVAANVLYYAPDVGALTEMDTAWHTYLPQLLNEKYGFLSLPNAASTHNTILYDKSKYDVVDSGWFKYGNVSQTSLGRNVIWAIFQNKTTGRKFAFTVTHWDWIDTKSEAAREKSTASQLSQGEELAAFVKNLKAQGLEVISSGDFNTGETKPAYESFMEKSEMTDSKYAPGVNVVNNDFTGHDLGIEPLPGSVSSADHIFITSGLNSVTFSTVITNGVLEVSDHCPIYADIRFAS